MVYFAQNAMYLEPMADTNPDPVTAAVGFNENATLPFEVDRLFLTLYIDC